MIWQLSVSPQAATNIAKITVNKATKKWLKYSLLAVICFSFPISGYSLGLGGLKLNSALNQKLDASIELLSITDKEFNDLSIQLATPSVYQRMGIELNSQLEQLRFEVIDIDGKDVIHVTTTGNVAEPYLNFLIEVNWASGRLIREFTVLLDPPVFLDEKSDALVNAPEADLPPVLTTLSGTLSDEASNVGEAANDQEASQVSSADEVASEVNAAASTAVIPSGVPSPSSLVYDKVQKNEVLWNIANKMRPENITIEQMMLALQRQNPRAFFGDNVSMLKAGAVLRIDDTATLSDVSVSQALLDIQAQNQAWLSYRRERQARNAVAADSAHLTPQGSDSNSGALGQIGREEGNKLETANAANQQLLKLITPSDDKDNHSDTSNAALEAAEDAATDLNIELVMATEELESKKQENENLVSRLGALEEQATAMQSIVQLKDAELAKMRTEDAAMVDADSLITPIKIEVPSDDSVGASVTKVVSKEVVDRARKLWQDPLTLGTGIFVVLLVALIGLMLKRKSARNAQLTVPIVAKKDEQKTAAEAAESISFPEDPATDAFANPQNTDGLTNNQKNAPFELDDALGDLAPMTDISLESTIFAELEGELETQLDENLGDTFGAQREESKADDGLLDAISEADMYIMYEKYDKAVTLLTAVIQLAPDRHELKLKLLEVYAESGDLDLFSAQADELYAAINGDESHPLWEEAQHFASVLGSDNPLFAGLLAGQRDNAEAFEADEFTDSNVVEFEQPSSQLSEGETSADNESVTVEWTPDQVTEFVAQDESQLFSSNDKKTEKNTDIPNTVEDDVFGTSILDAVDFDTREPIMEATTVIAEHDFSNFEILDDDQTQSLVTVEDDTLDVVDDVNSIKEKSGLSEQDLKNAMSEFTEESLGSAKITESEVTVDHVFDDVSLAEVSLNDDATNQTIEKTEKVAKVSDVSKDAPFGDTSLFLLSDKIGTKLDLARAYIEMGDREGASDLLNEVLSEGNQSQKLEAQSLMEMTTA